MGRAVTDSSTYGAWEDVDMGGSIRADVEYRAGYASGIIGGTVPTYLSKNTRTAAANFFFPGLPILPRGSGGAGEEEEARGFWRRAP
jgi:hypothetical protein